MPADRGPDPFRLDGRVAVVTGAGGGIGSATCIALSRAGAAVAAFETDAITLAATISAVEAEGGRALGLAGDVRREADVRRLFDEAEAQLGPVDLLVNTAFAARHERPDEMSLDDWEFNLEINLTGYFLCAREVARRMIARGTGGSIVNISSIAGQNGMGRRNFAYSVCQGRRQPDDPGDGGRVGQVRHPGKRRRALPDHHARLPRAHAPPRFRRRR